MQISVLEEPFSETVGRYGKYCSDGHLNPFSARYCLECREKFELHPTLGYSYVSETPSLKAQWQVKVPKTISDIYPLDDHYTLLYDKKDRFETCEWPKTPQDIVKHAAFKANIDIGTKPKVLAHDYHRLYLKNEDGFLFSVSHALFTSRSVLSNLERCRERYIRKLGDFQDVELSFFTPDGYSLMYQPKTGEIWDLDSDSDKPLGVPGPGILQAETLNDFIVFRSQQDLEFYQIASGDSKFYGHAYEIKELVVCSDYLFFKDRRGALFRLEYDDIAKEEQIEPTPVRRFSNAKALHAFRGKSNNTLAIEYTNRFVVIHCAQLEKELLVYEDEEKTRARTFVMGDYIVSSTSIPDSGHSLDIWSFSEQRRNSYGSWSLIGSEIDPRGIRIKEILKVKPFLYSLFVLAKGTDNELYLAKLLV